MKWTDPPHSMISTLLWDPNLNSNWSVFFRLIVIAKHSPCFECAFLSVGQSQFLFLECATPSIPIAVSGNFFIPGFIPQNGMMVVIHQILVHPNPVSLSKDLWLWALTKHQSLDTQFSIVFGYSHFHFVSCIANGHVHFCLSHMEVFSNGATPKSS